jgi:hypothetical protein
VSSSFRRPYTEVGSLAYALTEHLSTTTRLIPTASKRRCGTIHKESSGAGGPNHLGVIFTKTQRKRKSLFAFWASRRVAWATTIQEVQSSKMYANYRAPRIYNHPARRAIRRSASICLSSVAETPL